jgi:soluble lytic murein transglycosylase-like protein
MTRRLHRLTLTLLVAGAFLPTAGCSVRTSRPSDWDRPGQQAPAGSLRSFIRLTNKGLSPEMVDRITVALVRECSAANLDVRVVAALISKESSFNPTAVNPAGGARGLGQLMPDTARWLGVQDPFNPEQNVAGICKYLVHLRQTWAGGTDWVRILASYRLGQGTIKRSLETGAGIPPVGRDYAQDVLGRAGRITSLG